MALLRNPNVPGEYRLKNAAISYQKRGFVLTERSRKNVSVLNVGQI